MRFETRWGSGSVLFGLCVALAVGTAGCGDSGEVSLTGTWSGPIQDSVAGPGTVRFTIDEENSPVLSGTWLATFDAPAETNGGTFSGTFDGHTITMTATSSLSTPCPLRATATLQGDHRFTGTYAAFNCSGAITGELDVTRQ
jgi:hypothetical protein